MRVDSERWQSNKIKPETQSKKTQSKTLDLKTGQTETMKNPATQLPHPTAHAPPVNKNMLSTATKTAPSVKN